MTALSEILKGKGTVRSRKPIYFQLRYNNFIQQPDREVSNISGFNYSWAF